MNYISIFTDFFNHYNCLKGVMIKQNLEISI